MSLLDNKDFNESPFSIIPDELFFKSPAGKFLSHGVVKDNDDGRNFFGTNRELHWVATKMGNGTWGVFIEVS